MRDAPRNQIAQDAIKVWKITATLWMALLWIVLLISLAILNEFNWSHWISAIMIAIVLICTYIVIFRIPKLRYKRWRYEVFEKEIYIQHGLLIVTQTIIPMVRVQHVDTKQGPILKKYNLSTVTISTAATTHIIPALLEEDAANLRDRISELARVDEDDV